MTSIIPLPSNLPRNLLTARIAAWQGGSGPSMLLIHGVGLRAEAWTPMLPYLCKHFTVTAIDMPGHGQSVSLPKDESGLAAYIDVIEDALSAIPGPAYVVGHSMGAMIMLGLAGSWGKKLRGVVALNSIYRRSPDAAAAVSARAAQLSDTTEINPSSTLERWFGNEPMGDAKVWADCCRMWLTEADPDSYREAYSVFAREDGPSDGDLAQLACPALFVTGEEEPNSTPEMSRTMAALVPDGQAVVVADARHMLPMTHAETVTNLITDFAFGEVPSHG